MRVLKVFSDLGMQFEHLPSGIDTMSVVVHEDEIKGREDEVIAAMKEAVNPDFIEIVPSISLVAIVGRNMAGTPGTAARIFSALARVGVNIRMIDQGSSELNIIVGVDESAFRRTIKSIYLEFCIEYEL
jgi:aspartate kinase